MDNIEQAIAEQIAQFENLKKQVKEGDNKLNDLLAEAEKMGMPLEETPVIDEGILKGEQKLEYMQVISQYRDDSEDFHSGPIMA